MSDVMIRVEALPGSRVQDVAQVMWRIATILDVLVICDFNEVELMARPGKDSPDSIISSFTDRLRRRGR